MQAVKWRGHLCQRILRYEIDAFYQCIQRLYRHITEKHEGNVDARHLIGMNPWENDSQRKIVIAGSYRREKLSSGDIDVLMTGPSDVHKKLTELLEALLGSDNVLTISQGSAKSVLYVKWLGTMRHIDLRRIDAESWGSALQYFTGSKYYNIELRRKALSLGYNLSEYGLRKKDSGVLMPIHSEEELYDTLGLQWVEPKDRE